jgi:hypothetical protein
MRSFTVIIFSTMLLLSASPIRAQWTNVAPNLVAAEQQHIGALRFHGGVAWAGTTSLYVSNDTGLTWNAVPSFHSTAGISDIAIYDSLHVLVSTYGVSMFGAGGGDGVFLTADGGKTWTNFQPAGGGSRGNGQPSYIQIAFNGSTSVFHTLDYDASMLYTSINAGATWNGAATTNSNSTGSLCFAIAADKTVYVESYNGGQGWINKSTDLAQTWSGDSQITDGDCNTLSADSCNNERLYLINENVAQNMQSRTMQSRIDLTPNAGATWQTTSSYTADYYNGSLASTADVLYVGTVPNGGSGVDRSTDFGITWYNIGGQTEEYDTRSIAAVNNNIVLVLDANGSIWRTMNSGGYPVKVFSATPATVFASDTVSCDSLTQTVLFVRGGCTPLSVLGTSIIGADAASFKVSDLSNDSVHVTLYSIKEGTKQAELVLQLVDGSSDTINLAGYVNISPYVLSLTTENVQTDTLGGTVSVPITINGLAHTENVDLVLHYNGTLDYLGSFSPIGTTLDLPGEQWRGRSALRIIAAGPGQIAGYAKFNVFNDSNIAANATFDSVNVITASSPCEYSTPAPVTSTITADSGCGITILSQLIHFGQTPLFGISPNPATGNVWISSTLDMGDVTVEIYDMLGTVRSQIQASIQKDSPAEITLPDADGVYNIVLKSSTGMSTLRVVRQH